MSTQCDGARHRFRIKYDDSVRWYLQLTIKINYWTVWGVPTQQRDEFVFCSSCANSFMDWVDSKAPGGTKVRCFYRVDISTVLV